MKKSDLVVMLAQANELPQKTVAALLDKMLEIMQERLAADEDVAFPGFGVLYVVERPARRGRHPGTGEPIDIPARKTVRFMPGQRLKKRIANEQSHIE